MKKKNTIKAILNTQDHIRRKQLCHLSLSKHTKNLVLGSILGKGNIWYRKQKQKIELKPRTLKGLPALSLSKNERSSFFSICHILFKNDDDMKTYLIWKNCYLLLNNPKNQNKSLRMKTTIQKKKWNLNPSLASSFFSWQIIYHEKNTNKNHVTSFLGAGAHQWLNTIHEKMLEKNKKLKWNHLSSLSTAVWWFDRMVEVNGTKGAIVDSDKDVLKGGCLNLNLHGSFVDVDETRTLPPDGDSLHLCQSRYLKYNNARFKSIFGQYLTHVLKFEDADFSQKENKHSDEELFYFLIHYMPLDFFLYERRVLFFFRNHFFQQRWISESLMKLESQENLETQQFFSQFRKRYSPIL